MPKSWSARSVQAQQVPGYHRYGPGLYLQVAPSGTKSWLFRFKSPVTGKQREMGLGSLTILPLAMARQRAVECRQQVLNAMDPLEERKAGRRVQLLEQARALTFAQAAEQCIASKRPEWKNAKHAQQWVNTLTTHAYPCIGNLPISDLDTTLVLKVLEPIWVTIPETASRLRQRIEVIWDWAKARSYVTGENPARLRGHLDNLLPKTAKIKRVEHHPALPFNRIHEFIQVLRGRTGSSALALEFLIFTAARTGEVIGSRWTEIDLTSKVWTIPAARMKAGKEHRVPLCDRSLAILQQLQKIRGDQDFIFPGWKSGTGLSDGAMLVLMEKMQFGNFTPHGFRSSFRDWAAEEAHNFPNETVELALAHTIKNQAEAAYRRGDQLERRRELMRAWENYIESAPKSKTKRVVPLFGKETNYAAS